MTSLCTKLLNHCLGVGRLQVDADWFHAPHTHGFHQMMVILGGSLAVDCAGAHCEAKAGTYLCYPEGSTHGERVVGDDGAEFIYFAFDGPLLRTDLLVHDRNGRGRQLASWMAADASTADQHGDQLDRLLHALLGEWLRAIGDPTPGFVHRVRAWASDHLQETIRVDDLATLAAMSPAHFSRRYKQATGLTPMADLQRLRVELARNLIQTTDLTLAAIADRVGTCDGHHLSRLFKQHFGHPPGFFRGSQGDL